MVYYRKYVKPMYKIVIHSVTVLLVDGIRVKINLLFAGAPFEN